MTDVERLYVAAVKLPPSPERELLLDDLVRRAREERLPKSTLRRAAEAHYVQVLRAVAGSQLEPPYAALVLASHASLLASKA